MKRLCLGAALLCAVGGVAAKQESVIWRKDQLQKTVTVQHAVTCFYRTQALLLGYEASKEGRDLEAIVMGGPLDATTQSFLAGTTLESTQDPMIEETFKECILGPEPER